MKAASLVKVLGVAGALLVAAVTPSRAGSISPFAAAVRGTFTIVDSSGDFVESTAGHATGMGAVTYASSGTVTILSVDPATDIATITADAIFTLADANGDTVQGSWQTSGTFNLRTGTVQATGNYMFLSGTGEFSNVKGGGRNAAYGTAANLFCPFIGWIQD